MTRGYVTDRAKAPRFFVRWAAAAAVLACGLAVGACGPDTPEPTWSSSSGSSTVPSVTTPPEPVKSPEPVVPDAMADPGEEGAIAAAKYFLELNEYVYNTWDLAPWNAISDPGCEYCQSVVTRVGENQAKGQYLERLPTAFHDIAVEPPNVSHAHFIVTIKATQGKDWRYGPGHELVAETPARTQIIRLAVLRVGDGWVLYDASAKAVEQDG